MRSHTALYKTPIGCNRLKFNFIYYLVLPKSVIIAVQMIDYFYLPAKHVGIWIQLTILYQARVGFMHSQLGVQVISQWPPFPSQTPRSITTQQRVRSSHRRVEI